MFKYNTLFQVRKRFVNTEKAKYVIDFCLYCEFLLLHPTIKVSSSFSKFWWPKAKLKIKAFLSTLNKIKSQKHTKLLKLFVLLVFEFIFSSFFPMFSQQHNNRSKVLDSILSTPLISSTYLIFSIHEAIVLVSCNSEIRRI